MPTRIPPTSAPSFAQRRTVVVAGVVLFAALVIALSGRSWPIVVTRLFTDGAFLIVWLFAAAGWGSLLPLPEREDNAERCLRAVTRIAAGMGLISLVQLACGLAGILNRPVGIAVVVIGVALLAAHVRKRRSRGVADWFKAPANWEWLWLATVPALTIAVVAAFAMPGWLWGDEPHGYDVVEYHLQLPREWYELGRIAPLAHNVFSYFPLAMEMHYLLAMQLKGGPWAGMYLAQLMHVATVGLSVVAVYGVARPFATGKLPALLAAVAAANVPWLALLAPVAYNEGGLLLFATLTVGWVIRAIAVGATPASPSFGSAAGDAGVAATHAASQAWLTAGLMSGFACGVKLTAVPLLLLIIPTIAAIVAIARGEHIGRTVTGVAVFILAGALAFSPWLIRNYAWSRNPVFPEAQSVLGRAHFSETQSRRWQLAHLPTDAQRPLAARLRSAAQQIGLDWRFGGITLPAGGWRLPGLLVPLGVIVAAFNLRRPQAWVILALLAAWLVVWIGFTHLQGRFYVIAIPVAALALALPRRRWQVGVVAAVVAVQVMLGWWKTSATFAGRVAPIADEGLLGFEDLSEMMPQDLRDALAAYPDAPVALVGDAKAFLYTLPTPRLRYRTVFDVDTKPGESILDACLAGQAGRPIIVIDPIELDRFSKTYFGIDPLPNDVPFRRDRVSVLTPSAAPLPAPTSR